jgi:hypothetical protein
LCQENVFVIVEISKQLMKFEAAFTRAIREAKCELDTTSLGQKSLGQTLCVQLVVEMSFGQNVRTSNVTDN